MDEPNDRIADDVCLGFQFAQIDAARIGKSPYGLRGVGRNDPDLRLGSGKSHLDRDIPVNHPFIGEDRAHRRRTEHVSEYRRIENGGGHGFIFAWLELVAHNQGAGAKARLSIQSGG